MTPTTRKLRILFLLANPGSTGVLDIQQEMEQIRRRIADAKQRNGIELIVKSAVRWDELQRIVRQQNPDIVHFSGHGTDWNALILEGSAGGHHAVPGSALAELFRLLGDNVRVVVLNACHSALPAAAIAQHIDCVVGMRQAITDPAAIAFSAEFYGALAEGDSVQKAFELATNHLDLGTLGGHVPELLTKAGVDAARVGFFPDPSAKSEHTVLLHIDLATKVPVPLDDAIRLMPEEPGRVLHLSKLGVRRTPSGSELDWEQCVRAINEMMAAARAEAAGRPAHYYVVGHAALPVFAYLGLEISARVRVTLLNQRRNMQWDVLRLDDGEQPAGEPFFDVVEGLGKDSPSPAQGKVGVFISNKFRLNRSDVSSFLAAQGDSLAGVVEVRTSAEGEKIVDASNAARAAHDLVGVFDRIPAAYPHHTGLAVFIGTPATLAFLAGRAISPRVFGEVWLPNYDGRTYQPALKHTLSQGER